MIILIIYSIVHLLEARLEVVVIDLKNPYINEYNRLNREEHFWSAVLAGSWLFCGVLVAIHVGQYWILPALAVNRRIFFDYRLIQLRDRPRHRYEGDDWWRRVLSKIFGQNGRVKELIVELVITAVSVAVHYKQSDFFW